jgi:RHS repeat-associated protein
MKSVLHAGQSLRMKEYNPAADDLDYMHARFCSPLTGRFLSVDPVITGRALRRPQAWNRYSYVISNPLKYFDPYGELWFKIHEGWTYLEGVDQLEQESEDQDGNPVLTIIAGRETFIEFNGSQLTLYQKDGSVRSFTAVSGQLDEEGRTQPGLQSISNVGPIPEGQYYFNPAMIQNFDELTIHQQAGSFARRGQWPGGTIAWGRQRVELRPDRSTNTYGRGGFFIHGGLVPGSAGCIDLCGQAGSFFSAVPDIGTEIPVFVNYP